MGNSEPQAATEVQNSSASQAERAFVRLSGHLRLATATGDFVNKSTILAMLMLWAWNGSDFRGSDGYVLLIATAFWVHSFVTVLVGPLRWWILLDLGFFAVFATLVCACWTESAAYYSLAPMQTTSVLTLTAAGIVLSRLAAAAIERLLRPLATRGHFHSLLPLLGISPHGPGYRATVERSLARAEDLFARVIHNARSFLLATVVFASGLLSYAWAKDEARRGASASLWDRPEDALIWSGFAAVVGVLLGVALLPATRRRALSAIIVFMIAPMAASALVGVYVHASHNWSALGAAAQVMAICLVAATVAMFAARLIAGFAIQRLANRAIQAHLIPLGDIASAPTAEVSVAASLSCEACGYRLEGLPTVRCEKCGVDELRCPECGHTQPAETQHASYLRRLRLPRLLLRIAGWIIGIGASLLLLWLCFAAGSIGLPDRLSGSAIAPVGLIAALFIFPLFFVMLQWRGLFLAVCVPPLLCWGAMMLGALSSQRGFYVEIAAMIGLLFFAGNVLASVAWRTWIWMCLPANHQSVFRWQQSRAYRGKDVRAVVADPEGVCGKEMPLECAGCGADLRGIASSNCACEVRHVVCPNCSSHRPISAARIEFENLLSRARNYLLAMLVVTTLGVSVVVGIVQVSNTVDWAWAVIAGAFARLVLVRRPWKFAMIAIVGLFVFAHGVHFITGVFWQEDILAAVYAWWSTHVPVLAKLLIAVLIGMAMAPLLLRGAALLLLPRGYARPVRLWLSNKISMDQAAQQLPQ